MKHMKHSCYVLEALVCLCVILTLGKLLLFFSTVTKYENRSNRFVRALWTLDS